MNNEIRDQILKELECINGQCIVGDPTVIVFSILKNTDDLEALCKILHIPTKSVTVSKTVQKPVSMFDQLLASGIKLE